MAIVKSSETAGGRDVTILIEVDGAEGASVWGDQQVRSANIERMTTAAEGLFAQALDLIRSCATEIADGMRLLDESLRPSETSVDFSVKVDSAVGAVIAKVGAGAQLQVSMTWKNDR